MLVAFSWYFKHQKQFFLGTIFKPSNIDVCCFWMLEESRLAFHHWTGSFTLKNWIWPERARSNVVDSSLIKVWFKHLEFSNMENLWFQWFKNKTSGELTLSNAMDSAFPRRRSVEFPWQFHQGVRRSWAPMMLLAGGRTVDGNYISSYPLVMTDVAIENDHL